MSSGRSNGTPQGRLRDQATAARSTASPITPRLAANATSSKREPSPRRPFVKATSTSRNASPEKSLETPVRSLANSVVTPRSSTRPKVKSGSTVSTPANGTPASGKAKPTFASPRVAALQTPSDKDARNLPRLKATVDPRRDGNTLSPLAQEPVTTTDATIKNPSSMFFHANDVKSQDQPPRPASAAPPKRTAFFYANGQKEEPRSPNMVRPGSPALSVFMDQRSIVPLGRSGGRSEVGTGTRQRVTSPTLSAISHARSPFILSPVSLSPPGPGVRSTSPTKTDYLNTPSATLNHQRLRERATESEPPRTPMPNALGVTFDAGDQTATTPSPRSHTKSSSICAVATESPSAIRKRSSTWSEIKANTAPPQMKMNNQPRAQTASPVLPKSDTASSLTSPIIGDPMQSPSKELVDFAADARRERKVLDLEISNSSLLAINRTLEREVKKHKAELKRYRRLSRAGRFSVAPGALADDEAEGADGLPHVDGAFVGRPSSPFQEDVSDMDVSEEDDGSSDEEITSPNSSMTKEERQRAKDEAQLKSDLRKHRELLLDTARMNRSLQRCLTWTEDLIKDGKKALSHNIPSSEVRLGGRVLDVDDEEVSPEPPADDGYDDAGASAVADEQAEEGDDYTGIEAFLGMGPWQRPTAGRMSAGSEGTNRDSGVEMEKSSHRPISPTSVLAS